MKRLWRHVRIGLAIAALFVFGCASAPRAPEPSWTETQREAAFEFCAPRLKDNESCRCFVGAVEYFSAGAAPTRESVSLAFKACGRLA